MIIRVWGVVNSTSVEFTPIPDRPGYWEGYAPRIPGLQEIEIWAESSTGARGHLQCTVQVIQYHVHTMARIVLLPYVARLLQPYSTRINTADYRTRLKSCRKVG